MLNHLVPLCVVYPGASILSKWQKVLTSVTVTECFCSCLLVCLTVILKILPAKWHCHRKTDGKLPNDIHYMASPWCHNVKRL